MFQQGGQDGLKLIAGDNITLNYTEAGLVVSSSAPAFTDRLSRWMLSVDRRLGKPTIHAGRNIEFEMEAPDRIRINAKIPPAESVSTPVQVLNFPFKVARSGDNAVNVLGYNESAGRYFRNYVSLGTTRIEVAETELTGISSDSWIYLEIAWSGSAYSATLKSGSSLPEQTSTKYYVPIAFVRTSGGKVGGVHQVQFGHVDHPGRVF